MLFDLIGIAKASLDMNREEYDMYLEDYKKLSKAELEKIVSRDRGTRSAKAAQKILDDRK